MRSSKIVFYLCCVSLSLFNFCKKNIIEPTEMGGPGIIVPGISVEGIKLGDSRKTVEVKLGKPTSVGWADGLYRGWRLYSYAEGARHEPHVKLQFYFIDHGNSYGPVDWIGIGEAYKGKTKEGIGIGSALGQVRQAYGFPSETFLSQGIITDKYCLNGRKLEIGYKDSLVIGMSTGYFVPMPQDDPCK
ncbi:MAG: hypothetical protein GWP06_17595 [Actinobacteria bacterium]|nr:hypothetical protein [Actinomycetota bacterium]